MSLQKTTIILPHTDMQYILCMYLQHINTSLFMTVVQDASSRHLNSTPQSNPMIFLTAKSHKKMRPEIPARVPTIDSLTLRLKFVSSQGIHDDNNVYMMYTICIYIYTVYMHTCVHDMVCRCTYVCITCLLLMLSSTINLQKHNKKYQTKVMQSVSLQRLQHHPHPTSGNCHPIPIADASAASTSTSGSGGASHTIRQKKGKDFKIQKKKHQPPLQLWGVPNFETLPISVCV